MTSTTSLRLLKISHFVVQNPNISSLTHTTSTSPSYYKKYISLQLYTIFHLYTFKHHILVKMKKIKSCFNHYLELLESKKIIYFPNFLLKVFSFFKNEKKSCFAFPFLLMLKSKFNC